MSLNKFVSDNTLYTPDRLLNVKFGNIDGRGEVSGQNILVRQYQQLQSTAKTGTGANSLINTSLAKGSNIIPANKIQTGSKIYISSYGRFTYGTGQKFNFNFRFNGTRYIVNFPLTTSNNYTSGALYKIEQIIHISGFITNTATMKVFTKITLQNSSPSFTDEYFLIYDQNSLFDKSVDNTFDFEIDFTSSGGTLILDDLEMNIIF